MRNETKRNGILIGALLITIALMTVGYAALATQLTINGTAGSGDSSWSIDFTSIEKNTALSSTGVTEVNTPTASGTAITFNVNLSKPGDKMVYDVTVKNSGSIDAVFKQLTGVEEINTQAPLDITYTVQRLDVNGQVLTGEGDLLSNQNNYFRITIEWNPNSTAIPEVKSKTGTIYLDYQQK